MSRFDYQQPDPEHEDEQRAAESQAESLESTAEQRLGLAEDESGVNVERLRYVEDLLRKAPLISVPIGFAERVVAAIKGKDTDDPDYNDALGLVLGLLISIIITLAALGFPAYFIITAVLTGDATTVIADVTDFFGNFVGWMADLPVILLPAAAASVLGVIFLSGYVLWFVRGLLMSRN